MRGRNRANMENSTVIDEKLVGYGEEGVNQGQIVGK